jgi:FkbM family methyltransferase
VADDSLRQMAATPLARARSARRWLAWIAGTAKTKAGRASLRRSWVFDAIGRESPSVAVQVGDTWFFVPTKDVLGKLTFLAGGFEQDVMEAAVDLLEQRLGHPPLTGRIFVDIGANIGTSTIPALTRLGASRAIAIEPAATNCRLLRANVAANGLDERVTIVEAALSDRPGTLSLELGPDNSGDYRIRLSDAPGAIGEAGWRTQEVVTSTFDQMLEDEHVALADVGLVWMDTQGHEAHVFGGASSLLESSVPVIVEYWPYGLRRAEALERLHTIVSTHYRAVIDVRASMEAGRLHELPAKNICMLADRYDSDHHWEYTDIALLK